MEALGSSAVVSKAERVERKKGERGEREREIVRCFQQRRMLEAPVSVLANAIQKEAGAGRHVTSECHLHGLYLLLVQQHFAGCLRCTFVGHGSKLGKQVGVFAVGQLRCACQAFHTFQAWRETKALTVTVSFETRGDKVVFAEQTKTATFTRERVCTLPSTSRKKCFSRIHPFRWCWLNMFDDALFIVIDDGCLWKPTG